VKYLNGLPDFSETVPTPQIQIVEPSTV